MRVDREVAQTSHQGQKVTIIESGDALHVQNLKGRRLGDIAAVDAVAVRQCGHDVAEVERLKFTPLIVTIRLL